MIAVGKGAWLVALTLGAWATGWSCTPEPPQAPPTRPSLLDGVEAAPAYQSPALWRYHPKEEPALIAAVELPNGARLLAGRHGERWLVERGQKVARPAARLAPEDLVHVAQREDGGWLFVGRSGTTYESETPIGPFTRSGAPLEPLVRTAASGSVVVGVRRDGALLRSDDAGASWSRVGPGDVRFSDVALAEDGAGLGLAVPERLYSTKDFGATWSSLDQAPFGAFAVTAEEGEAVTVRSLLGERSWQPGPVPSLVPAGSSARAAPKLNAGLALGPDGGALHEGRATVFGRRYREARRGSKEWRWVSGAIDEPLTSAPLPVAKACEGVRIASYGDIVYLACARDKGFERSQTLEFYRSKNDGRTWEAEPYLVRGVFEQLRLLVGPRGGLVVSGVCPATNNSAGCSPLGVHTRRTEQGDAGPTVRLVPSATPGLLGPARGLTAALDFTRVYALGYRAKNRALVVFVSRDGGRTFAPHEVDQLALSEGASEDAPASDEVRVLSAAAAEDRSVAFVLQLEEDRVLMVTDDNGRVLSISRPPTSDAVLGAVGSRALAVAFGSRQVWESLDAGTAWNPVGRLPLDVCPGSSECGEIVFCHLGGCVLGASLSRVGWRGQSDEDSALIAPPRPPRAGMEQPRVRTPYVCSLEEGSWRPLPERAFLPTANQAAIGDVAWFSAVAEPKTGSVSVLHGRGGESPKVDVVELLSSVSRSEDFAYAVSVQVEGIAALRYRIPGTPGARGPMIVDVEVAWDNRLERQLRSARIPSVGALRAGDVQRDARGVQRAQLDLMSIASSGIYVRAHEGLQSHQPTYFVTSRGTESIPGINWPASALRGTRAEMAHVGSHHVPLRLSESSLVRARREGEGWTFDAITTGLRDAAAFGLEQELDIAYAGTGAGLQVTLSDRQGRDAVGWFYPFQAEGAVVGTPERVPTQLGLPAEPKPCSRFQREQTSRFVIPYQAGTRHPVLVTDPMDPMRLLVTGAAVVYGSATAPCVAAFEAVLAAERRGSERALVILDDLEHSWMFREASASEGNAVPEYRSMSCRLDPGGEIPLEIYQAPGTLVP